MRKRKPRRTRRNKGRHWEIKQNPFFVGWKQVFSMFFGWCTPTKKVAPKRKEKDNLSHVANTGDLKTVCCNPPLDQKLVICNLHCCERRTVMFFLMSTRKNQKKKRKKGLEAQRQETPKNEQGKTKDIFNWIYGCSYVIKRKHTPKKQKEKKQKFKDKRRQETRKETKDWWEKKTL